MARMSDSRQRSRWITVSRMERPTVSAPGAQPRSPQCRRLPKCGALVEVRSRRTFRASRLSIPRHPGRSGRGLVPDIVDPKALLRAGYDAPVNPRRSSRRARPSARDAEDGARGPDRERGDLGHEPQRRRVDRCRRAIEGGHRGLRCRSARQDRPGRPKPTSASWRTRPGRPELEKRVSQWPSRRGTRPSSSRGVVPPMPAAVNGRRAAYIKRPTQSPTDGGWMWNAASSPSSRGVGIESNAAFYLVSQVAQDGPVQQCSPPTVPRPARGRTIGRQLDPDVAHLVRRDGMPVAIHRVTSSASPGRNPLSDTRPPILR